MEAKTLAQLNHINQQFYQNFADSFSQTRHRIQTGVERVLSTVPRAGNFLDIGCGNGNLAREWGRRGFEGSYYGVDFSAGLVEAARKSDLRTSPNQTVKFLLADLTGADWAEALPEHAWDSIFCFAVLHHIPGMHQRERLCRRIGSLVKAETPVWVSVWQPLNSSRLAKRIYAWENVGISGEDVDSGDALMDWRAHGSLADWPALRYVHIFTEDALASLAARCGFAVKEQFYSDGKEGNLGLYQCWINEN